MYIDGHVHFRGFEQDFRKYGETIEHGLIVARDSGLDAVFDMPNTNPPLMTRDLVLDRLEIAKRANMISTIWITVNMLFKLWRVLYLS